MVNATTFKIEDNPTLESLTMNGDIDLNDNDIINVNVARFALTPSLTPAEGDLYWNNTDKTLNVKTDTDTVIQIGQEMVLRSKNNTGVQVNNGEVVYISGADSARPEITLGNAESWETSQATIGIATQDIANESEGFVTVFGLVRDVDTSGMAEGAILYLGTTDGEFTTTRPTFPDFVVRVGFVISVNATTGILFFAVDHNRNESFFNGTINEQFNALVTSAAGTITMSLERAGGGDLTLRFSDGPSTLATTPAATIELTAGTDAAPQANYIYIPQASKVLTKSTTTFPTAAEHIKVGFFLVQSAARVASDGALINQNWNDHGAGSDLMGHMAHVSERIRHEGALYVSGLGGNGVDDYLTLALNSSFFISNAGVIYQMHRHTVPAFDQSGGDEVLIVNDSVTAYLASSDLYTDITADSTGAAIGLNKYFNLVFIGVGNKTGEYSPILCNLPSGSYNTQAGAEQDTSGFDNYDIPDEFDIDSSTGFLICRLTIQMGTTWTYISTVDLRKANPATAAGGAPSAAVTSFNDGSFDVHNATDPTKIMTLDISNVTTATTRTLTVQDADGIIALTADITADIATHAAINNAHHTATVAGDLNHNDLANIDAGDIKHITAAQLGALHAVYTIAADLAANKTISGAWIIDNATGLTWNNQGGGADPILSSDHAGQFLKINLGFEFENADVGDNPLLFSNAATQILDLSGSLEISGALTVDGNIATGGTVDGVDIAARDHAATVAGDLNHNDLANIDAGDVKHITAAQLGALHAVFVPAGVDAHTDLTATGAQIEDLIEFGSANGAWYTLSEMERGPDHWTSDGARQTNQVTGDVFWIGYLSIPPLKQGLKLYVDDVRLSISVADGNDFVTEVWVRTVDFDTVTDLAGSPHNVTWDSADDHVLARAASDASGLQLVMVVLKCDTDSVAGLRFAPPQIFCYYDT